MNIKELAKQATYDLKDEFGNWIGHGFDKEKFAELVAAHEREACAKIARNVANATEPDDFALDKCNEIEDAIRARSKA